MKNLFSKSFSKKKLAVISASFLVFAAVFGIFLFETTKKTVAITLDGQKKVIKTHAKTIQDLFDELDISLHSKDYVFPTLNTEVKDNLKIVWKPAKQVQVVQGKEQKTVWTTAETVKDLLLEQKIIINEHDVVQPKPEEAIKNKMQIGIKRAFPLTLVDGGKKQQVWSTSTTVADFLSQQGITLKDLDRVEPKLHETVKKNAVVNVIRVEKVTDVVEEPINFAVVTKKDANLTKGSENVIKEGEQGLLTKKYEVVLENGKEVSRTLISEQKIKDKQDKIVAVGTKVISEQVSRGSAEDGREFYVNSTAYTASCNGCSGITSSGINLRANPNVKVIAVDPRVIPLGTKVYVEGYGYAVAADTGSAINGYKIDVFFPTNEQAYRWGNKMVKIKVLN
ncbi:hypothetical protein C0971_00245 [Bacillus methanolicus]|uniref:G5 and 3D domain-containing protein n=1 Tax=Bacillus methanolicus TaxID=1471 RepID=UPI00200C4263|nr:G5 and 3D domain-containing protein [Bacillus methanolicus]UQD50662.1 hypothetical protein C0971_00245 [Bacillus methanolicus]